MRRLSKNQKQRIAKLKIELYKISEDLAEEKPLSSSQVDLIQDVISSIYKTGEYKLPKLRGRPENDQLHHEWCMTYQLVQFEKNKGLSLDDSFRQLGEKNGMSWEDVRSKYYKNESFIRSVMHLPEWQDFLMLKEHKD